MDTFAELYDRVQSRLHRTVPADDLTEWADISNARIGAELRAKCNETRPPVAAISGQYTLDEKFQELRYVRQVRAGRIIDIPPLPIGVGTGMPEHGNYPVGYTLQTVTVAVSGTLIYIPTITLWPRNDEDIQVSFWYAPRGQGSNAITILQTYPQLYIYSMLAEGWDWALSEQRSAKALQQFAGEMDAINKREMQARHGPGMAQQPAAGPYNSAPSRGM